MSPSFFMVHLARIAFLGFCLVGASCCKKDEKKDEGDSIPVTEDNKCAFEVPGRGCSVKATGDTVTLDFASATAGQQYVIAPFILGDPNTIAGSLKTRNFTFNVSASTGTSLQLIEDVEQRRAKRESLVEPEPKFLRDHDKRTLANHFDPSKGAAQEPWFWQLARNLDTSALVRNEFNGGSGHSVEAFYRGLADSGASLASPDLTLTADDCPSSQINVPKADGVGLISAPIADSYADPDNKFCIAYVSNPVTVSDKEAIKAAISKISRIYSGSIYGDNFIAKGNYRFRPVFVFVDVADEDVWDQSEALNLAGVFVSYTSVSAGYPIIYIASDFTKVASFGESSQTEVLKGQFFSVMAHELQHAILHYYRLNPAGNAVSNGEPVSIDEGLAHFMEDLFGYGADGFKFWALPFLQGYTDGVTPFLVGSNDYGDGVSAPLARSAAHTLLYYLSSQKGGVNFDSNGEPSGGGGLTFVKNLVKSTTFTGPANLAANFGGDWAVVIGNYLGALAVDNLDVGATVASKFTVQKPSNTVTNLAGKSGQSYGMRFNNYLDLTSRQASDYGNPKGNPAISNKMSYYMTAPLLLTVTNPGEKIVFKCDCGGDAKNVAASVVRVK